MVGLGAELNEFHERLRLLDELLLQKAPSIRAALRPGLDDAKVHALLKGFPHAVPDEVPLLYAWHDGAAIVDEPDRAELFPNAQMLPLEEAIRKWRESLEAGKGSGRALWDPLWFPMFVGYKWLFWAIRSGPGGGSVVVFDWVDLPEVSTAYSDLRSMIERLVRGWSVGAYREGPNASVEQDDRKVAQVNRELDQEPADVDQLIADLGSGDDHLYNQALDRLRTRLYPEAVPGLIRMLDTASGGRIAAVELLGAIDGPEAMACLRRAAEADPDDHIRQMARHTIHSSD
jgi:hypothetical protein